MSLRSIIFTGVLAGATILAAAQATAQSPAASYDVVHNHWSMGARMPIPTTGPAVGAIGGNIYVVGGYSPAAGFINVNQTYNTKTNQWTMGAAMPDSGNSAVGAVVNGILYVIGAGPSTNHNVQAYDPVTNTWLTGFAPMPGGAWGFSAAADNNVIYIMGGNITYPCGLHRCTATVVTVQSYNPATNTWAEEAPMLVGQVSAAVGPLGAAIVSAGGLCIGHGCSAPVEGDNEYYSSTNNSWKSLTAVPTPRYGGCAGAIGGRFYFAGGSGTFAGNALNVLEAYSPKTNSWTPLSSMPVAVDFPGSAEVGGRLYCFGGYNIGGSAVNYAQIYTP